MPGLALTFRCCLWRKTGAGEGRFDASHKHQQVTESSYINSLANRPYRSTIKTLPATLPEPWTTVRGPSSKHIGPWSTDLEPRIVDLGSRFKLHGSRLPDAGPGVTGDGCEIWIDLVRGAGCRFGVASQHLEFCFKQSQQDISLDDHLSNVPAPVSLIYSLQWQQDIACETGNPTAGLAVRVALPLTRAPPTGLYGV